MQLPQVEEVVQIYKLTTGYDDGTMEIITGSLPHGIGHEEELIARWVAGFHRWIAGFHRRIVAFHAP